MAAVKVPVKKRTRKKQVNTMKIIVGEMPLPGKVTQGCEGKSPTKKKDLISTWVIFSDCFRLKFINLELSRELWKRNHNV